MPDLFLLIIFSLLGGLLSVGLAALYLIVPAETRKRLLPSLVSFAIGALLGAAFLGLIPEALETESVPTQAIGATLLFGILLFFLLEKLVLWRHSHDAHSIEDGDHHLGESSAGSLILIGDGIHNLVDGILIGSAFLVDVQLGIVTSIAVAAHEIPQELGDFAILLNSGMKAGKALLLNVLTSLTTVVGALLAWFTFPDDWLPFILSIAAASFIYVAVADLIPGLQKKSAAQSTLAQILLISAGVATILAGQLILH